MSAQLLCIGQDDGHDTNKVCYGFDAESKKYRYGYYKSRAVEGLHQVMAFGNQQSTAYETEGQVFTVADGQALIRAIDTRSVDYPTSNLNRVLVNHALAACGLADVPIYLVTGLPVNQYLKDGKPNTDLINRKTASLSKPVQRVGSGPGLPRIIKQGVVSEGIAAFYDALIQPDGSLEESIEQLISRRPIAVCDLGGGTLDIAVIVENVAGVYSERSGTENIGVLNLITKVAQRIKSEFNLNNDPPAKYVEEAFRTKQYEFFGDEKDVSEIIKTACREYLAEVRNFFVSKVGDGSDLGAVIFVGGGAALVRSALGDDAFEQVYKGKRLIADEPEFANARGMWKYAMFVLTDEDRAFINEMIDQMDQESSQQDPLPTLNEKGITTTAKPSKKASAAMAEQ